ncbi:MAG TPA: formate dehydrogenase subunit gamma [Xanthobacteraceae bacterium]|jgi:formate dehydrogenase subunit gamma
MATLFTRIGSIAGAIMLLWIVAVVTPTAAQQPNTVNPTASAVQEEKLLQEMRRLQGRITIPDERASVLEQPAGRDWRQFHQVTLHWIGGISILGMLVILILFYTIRGMIKMSRGRSGRTITRFNGLERFMHWLTAGTFIVLAISGINVTFGKTLLLPLLGPEAFTGFSQWAKYAHNYLSFPFTLGLVFIFFMWIKDNIPNAVDAQWLKEGGGLVGKAHPPAYKFNAGQKIVFWVVAIGGGAVAISGYLLMFPFYGTGISGMQTAQVIHGIVGVLMIAAMLAHIYIGTLGMEGAFEAMSTGEVDLHWAEEHHSLWVEDEMEKSGVAHSAGRRPAAART